MRFVVFPLLLVLILSLASFKTLNPGKKSGVRTVVIDAGHGGHDPGCQYGGAKEKEVTLAIALKLGKIIKENCKDVKVIYTRSDDTFVELHERAAIANRNNAMAFISIHCNANDKKEICGTETYTMGLHKTADNLNVAKRENDVVLLEDDYTERYDGFNPKSPQAHIIFSLYQDAYFSQSLRLASRIENEFKTKALRTSRGVKQAGFLVLWKTTMPSILIETGFLSNTAERKYLTSDSGQTYLASGIYRAFKEFKTEVEATRK
ncbi:MAG: N-acetylmuramoyl-L-alanine amidase [Sphingobacteriales bacterium]|nr:MAG: N-acetylmuramoyl-L-alanine amidase [Sphingobacteriales bacterium]